MFVVKEAVKLSTRPMILVRPSDVLVHLRNMSPPYQFTKRENSFVLALHARTKQSMFSRNAERSQFPFLDRLAASQRAFKRPLFQ